MLDQSLGKQLLRLTGHGGDLPALADLLLRANLVFALALLFACLLRKQPASWHHLTWQGCILSLLLLPLCMLILPAYELAMAPQVLNLTFFGTGSFSSSSSLMMEGLHWVGRLYVFGAIGLLLYTVLGLLQIFLLTCKAYPAHPRPAQLLAALHREAGLHRRVRLRESVDLAAPVSWGLFHPVILLPVSARYWADGKLRHVLIHELAHIQRLDWGNQLLARGARALYWYNPLVWYATRRLEEAAECACDDAVLLQADARCDYATDLLSIARQVQGRQQAGEVQAVADSFLGRRLQRILNPRSPRCLSEALYAVRSVLICLPLLALVASVKLVPQTRIPVSFPVMQNLIAVTYLPGMPGEEQRTVAPAPFVNAQPQLSELLPRTGLPSLAAEVREVPGKQALQLPSEQVPVPNDLPSLHLPWGDSPVTVSRRTRLVRKAAAEYPAQARQKGIEGYSLIEYSILPDGQVSDPVVIESNPGAMFDRSALQAIKHYHYEPLQINGEDVAVEGVRTRFTYRLRPKPG